MKKIFTIFTVLVVFTLSLVLAGCPTDDTTETNTNPNSDVIGTWKNSSGTMTLEIGDGTFTWVLGIDKQTGEWTRQGTILTLKNRQFAGTAILSDGKLQLRFTGSYYSTEQGPYDLTRPGNETQTKTTTLKIKNESFTELTDVSWQGVSFGTISTGGANVTKNVGAGTGYLYFTPKNSINARARDIVSVEKDDNIEFIITDNTVIVDTNNTANTGTLGTLGVPVTLKIKNESFTEITGVVWQGVSFANNQYENSIKTGTSVTQDVSNGAGYIFFKRKDNPINARTRDIVTVDKGINAEFIFTDNTAIVEVGNTSNTGTLSALQSTVVFFDDAEGEMQEYHAKQSFVGYYNTRSDITNQILEGFYLHTPKNGNKSVAVGGTNTAKLHLRITLTKPAKLSFWVANKYNGSAGTTFSINGTVKETWTTDLDWSLKTYTLEVGQNDIVWEKRDGNHSIYTTRWYYLSLDDILIYYTE